MMYLNGDITTFENTRTKAKIVTIDGQRGSGKSLLAKGLRDQFGCGVLEIGPIFRLLAWLMTEKQLSDPLCGSELLIKLVRDGEIKFNLYEGGAVSAMTIDFGRGLSEEVLWLPNLDPLIKKVAEMPDVIEQVTNMARYLVNNKNVVVVGRETGAKMFPEAVLKIVLFANQKVCNERKISQLVQEVSEIQYGYSLSNSEPNLDWEMHDEMLWIETTNCSPQEILKKVASHLVKFTEWKASDKQAYA